MARNTNAAPASDTDAPATTPDAPKQDATNAPASPVAITIAAGKSVHLGDRLYVPGQERDLAPKLDETQRAHLLARGVITLAADEA